MREVKVGIFIFLGIVSLLYLTFQIKSLESLKEKGYIIYAKVNDASGLRKKSRVKLRGVSVGIVKDMKLDEDNVLLTLEIKKGVKIPVGSMVTLAQDNVLGGKYLKIIPSNSKEYLPPKSTISKYLSTASMEDVMNNINKAVDDVRVLIGKLNQTLDKNTTQNIQLMIANLKESSSELKNILKVSNEKIPLLLDNANALVLSYKKSGDILKSKLPPILDKSNALLAKLNTTADIINKKLPKLADEYIKLGKNANTLLVENKEGLKGTIDSAEDFFASGAKSFEKLDNFLASAQKSQIEVEINSNYLDKDEDFKTTANLAYRPTPTKYYILGLTSRKDYSNINPDDESKMYINALIGKRYNNLLLKGGFIESSAGVGVDYFMLNDRLRLSSEIYDFNSQNDYRGSNAHLNAYVTYVYLKHIEFLAGVENILNTDARSFFVGVGVKFIDNDLKTLIAGGASSFLK
ncbi:MAG: MCE family protein [Epsilonproteobacteria bacterium]|nr:MCE family protein [Campylobacterota bacterium]